MDEEFTWSYRKSIALISGAFLAALSSLLLILILLPVIGPLILLVICFFAFKILINNDYGLGKASSIQAFQLILSWGILIIVAVGIVILIGLAIGFPILVVTSIIWIIANSYITEPVLISYGITATQSSLVIIGITTLITILLWINAIILTVGFCSIPVMIYKKQREL